MVVSQIKKLRNARKGEVDHLLAKLEEVKKDPKYSVEYQAEQEGDLNRQLETVRNGYDEEIAEVIAQGKRETRQALDKAEFADLQAGDETKLLIIEMRNRDLAEDLARTYESEKGSKFNESMLYRLTVEQVEDELSTAPAYINAMKQLKINGADELNKQYLEATMTPTQRSLTDKLKEIEEQANAYEVEKISEYDPLKGALTEYYTDQLSE